MVRFSQLLDESFSVRLERTISDDEPTELQVLFSLFSFVSVELSLFHIRTIINLLLG
jgi:hypothetical protein